MNKIERRRLFCSIAFSCACLFVMIFIPAVLEAQGDDACGGNTTISIPGSDSGDTSLLSDTGGYTSLPDAWYRLDIPSGATCTVDICLSAPDGDCWDTYLGVWNSSCSQEIAHNYDESTTCSGGGCSGSWGGASALCQSRISGLSLGPGPATYYICCEGETGYGGDGFGPYCLEITGSCTGYDCVDAVAISCATGTLTGENNGEGPPGTNNWASYSASDCSGWDESGPESVYLLTNDTGEDQTVNISIQNATADVDIFVLSDCDSATAWDCDDESVFIFVPAGVSYYIVVDGYNGAVADYDLAIDCQSYCAYQGNTIHCGDALTGETTTGNPAMWDDYSSCATGLAGSEKIYTFDLDWMYDTFSVQLSNMTTNLDILVLKDDCDNDTGCVAHGDDSVTVSPADAGTYYLVVDSASGEEGAYDISVTCSSSSPTGTATATPVNQLDCTNPTPVAVSCGGTYSGSTSQAFSRADRYNCVGYDESGPEVLHSLTLSSPEPVTILMNPSGTTDLDMFLLSDCDSNTCMDYSAGTASERIFRNLDAGTYYISVDGYRGVSGGYELSVICGDTPTPSPTPSAQLPTGTAMPTPTSTPSPTPSPTPTNTPTPTATPELPLDCSGAVTLNCGITWAGNTLDGTNHAVTYSCASDAVESGPEEVFLITVAKTQDFTFNLLPNYAVNLDLFLLDACNQSNCLDASVHLEGLETIAITLDPGDYYLVVDGYRGAAGAYTLYYDCPPEPLDCSSVVSLSCDVPLSGQNNSGGDANVDTYACAALDESGPEVVYSLLMERPGRLTITLAPTGGGDLDLFLLNTCDENDCLAYSSSGNVMETITYVSTGHDKTFYIVADGYRGDVGSFQLLAECDYFQTPTPPTATPMPTLTPTPVALPIPATKSGGIVILLTGISILIFGSIRIRRKADER